MWRVPAAWGEIWPVSVRSAIPPSCTNTKEKEHGRHGTWPLIGNLNQLQILANLLSAPANAHDFLKSAWSGVLSLVQILLMSTAAAKGFKDYRLALGEKKWQAGVVCCSFPDYMARG